MPIIEIKEATVTYGKTVGEHRVELSITAAATVPKVDLRTARTDVNELFAQVRTAVEAECGRVLDNERREQDRQAAEVKKKAAELERARRESRGGRLGG